MRGKDKERESHKAIELDMRLDRWVDRGTNVRINMYLRRTRRRSGTEKGGEGGGRGRGGRIRWFGLSLQETNRISMQEQLIEGESWVSWGRYEVLEGKAQAAKDGVVTIILLLDDGTVVFCDCRGY